MKALVHITEVSNRMALIALNHPPSNALKIDLLKEPERSMKEVLDNSAVKVIVITGRSRSFSTGADILE